MPDKQDTNLQRTQYCWNCGASNATDTGIVRVNYKRRGGSNESRPHCTECAHVTGAVSNIFLIITLSVVLILSLWYVINEWGHY